MNQHESRLG